MGAAISWHSRGPVLVTDGHVIAKDYRTILEDRVHPMVQTLYPEHGVVYQDDNAPIYTAKLVTEWFDEHESEAEHLPWPAQSPDLNIIEPLKGVLEERIRKHFPPPASHSDVATILQEEGLKVDFA